MSTVTFVPVEKDGRYQFHNADGTEVIVQAPGHTTGNPEHIAVLDSSPFVTRKPKKGDS